MVEGSKRPDRIGRYRILDELGSGGMGVVYVAEQTEPVRRRVALKVVHELIGEGSSARRRFLEERQALASMEHDHIARVYDAGETDDGEPFLVMELVRGVSITDYCDRNRLGVAERLELMRKVCEGVQHAHLKGIVHRDLKPSNVLVTDQGGQPVPKIIDFGLARGATDRDGSDMHTQRGALIGTPEYMSPEQASLEPLDIDTRSDVFSLGVLLFELLVGDRPVSSSQHLKGGKLEMLRRIVEEEAPSPTSRLVGSNPTTQGIATNRSTTLPRLRKTIRGDLEWITLRALQRDRTRRYQTASELAEDLRRHLTAEPVSAGPPGFGYRFGKLVQRYRGPAAVAAIVLVALLGSLLFSLSAWHTAEAAAEKEREARSETRKVLRRQLLVSLSALGTVNRWLFQDPGLAPTNEEEFQRLLAERETDLRNFQDLAYEATLLGGGIDLGAEQLELEADPEFARLHAAAWQRFESDACSDGTDQPYAGLRVPRLPTLLPLGPQPDNGLWQFHHVTSAEPSRRRLDRPVDGPLDAGLGLVFVLVPGGNTRVGSASGDPHLYDAPAYELRLDPYFVSKYELDYAQWQRMVGARARTDIEAPGQYPVSDVSWDMADALLRLHGMSLPSEAQWEHAAAGGSTTAWPGVVEPDDLARIANLSDQAARRGLARLDQGADDDHEDWDDGYFLFSPVGSFEGNGFGLHDVIGNVREWCLERDDVANNAEPRDGDGLRGRIDRGDLNSERACRGGNITELAATSQLAYRAFAPPEAIGYIGIRPIIPLVDPPAEAQPNRR